MKLIAIAAAALIGLTASASAKNKMEKVDVVQDGIDLQTIVVNAGSSGYTGVKNSEYRFSLRGYAAAKSGYRILGAWFHAGKLDQSYDYKLFHRDIGSGQNRTVKVPISFKVPVGKIVWDGDSPLAACKANLSKLKKSGFTEAEILGKSFDLKLQAIVGFSAVADREWRDPSPINFGGGSTWKTKTMRYKVDVECAARPERAK